MMLWWGSQALRHFSTSRVSPVKASIHILVLLSRLRGLQGRDGEARVGSDAQTLLERTTAFFQTGGLQRSLRQYPGWELSSEPLSAAENQLQTWLSDLAGMTSWGLTMSKGSRASLFSSFLHFMAPM